MSASLQGIFGVERDIARLRDSLRASAKAVAAKMETLCAALESRDVTTASEAFDQARASIALANISLGRWSQFIEWVTQQRGMHDVKMMQAGEQPLTEDDTEGR